jgi:hypothetical protein
MHWWDITPDKRALIRESAANRHPVYAPAYIALSPQDLPQSREHGIISLRERQVADVPSGQHERAA